MNKLCMLLVSLHTLTLPASAENVFDQSQFMTESTEKRILKYREDVADLRRLIVYKLSRCATGYAVLKNNPSLNHEQKAQFEAAAHLYLDVAVTISEPFTLTEFEFIMEQAQSALLDMRRENNRRIWFDYLEECQNFSDPRLIERVFD